MTISEDVVLASTSYAGIAAELASEDDVVTHVDPEQRLLKVGLVGFGRTGREVGGAVLADPSMSLEWVVKRTDRTDDRSAGEVLGVSSRGPGMITR